MRFKKGDVVINISQNYSDLGKVVVEEDNGSDVVLVHAPHCAYSHSGGGNGYQRRDEQEYLWLLRDELRKVNTKNKTDFDSFESKNFYTRLEKVIYSDKYTIVFLCDGRKGVAKCHPDDKFDKTRGLEVATAKALLKEPKSNGGSK